MDTVFGTDGIRAKVNEYPMQIDTLLKISLFVGAQLLMNGKPKEVVIGKDTRFSCDMFESALIAGFLVSGINVHVLGVVPTSAVSFFTQKLKASCGVMVTASHNDYHYNGVKIFGEDGAKISEAMQHEIDASLYDGGFNINSVSLSRIGKIRNVPDAEEGYIDFITGSMTVKGVDFSGIKVALDTANGSAYRMGARVFDSLGIPVKVINDNPSGYNINEQCGALYPHELAQVVKSNGYDLGIALDGDADRVIFVDECGELVDGDYVVAAIVNFYKNRGMLSGDAVVGTILSNIGLEKYLATMGLRLIRTKVGDRYVYEKMSQIGAIVGGEPSGHVILPRCSKVGDGLIVALEFISFLKEHGLKASDVRNLFQKSPQKIINIGYNGNSEKIMESIDSLVNLMRSTSVSRVSESSRIIVRKSGTEPIIRVMIEADDVSEVDYVAGEIQSLVSF